MEMSNVMQKQHICVQCNTGRRQSPVIVPTAPPNGSISPLGGGGLPRGRDQGGWCPNQWQEREAPNRSWRMTLQWACTHRRLPPSPKISNCSQNSTVVRSRYLSETLPLPQGRHCTAVGGGSTQDKKLLCFFCCCCFYQKQTLEPSASQLSDFSICLHDFKHMPSR